MDAPPNLLSLSRSQRETFPSISIAPRQRLPLCETAAWNAGSTSVLQARRIRPRVLRVIFRVPRCQVQMCADEKGDRSLAAQKFALVAGTTIISTSG